MKISLFILIMLLSTIAFAQDISDSTKVDTTATESAVKSQKQKSDQRPVMNRISFGGSTGFWIQPSRTHVEISGLLAYRFPKILTIGPGYRYIYTRNRVYGKNLHSYGPNAFARAQLTKRIYAWTEWEYLKTEYAVQVGSNEISTRSDHVESFFGGLGYIRQIGRKGRGGLSFQVLYNFLYNREDYSPYYSPVIYRVGYFF